MKNFVSYFKTLPVSTRRLMGLGTVVALVVALPLFVWSISSLNFNPKEKADVQTTPLIIYDTFDGNGNLDSSKWSWSSYAGDVASLGLNKLRMNVSEGFIDVGDYNKGRSTSASVLVNYQIPHIVGEFDVSIDVDSLEASESSTLAGIKFAPAGGIMLVRRRSLEGSSIEILTSSTNTIYTTVESFALSENTGSIRLRLLKTQQDIQAFYDIGNGYVLLFTTTNPGYVNPDDLLPFLIVENDTSDYPSSTAFFDNFSVNANMLVEATSSPTSSSTESPTGSATAIATATATSTASATPTATVSISPTILGDVNADHLVNGLDLGIVVSKYGSNDANADLNHDGIVNIVDIGIVINNY